MENHIHEENKALEQNAGILSELIEETTLLAHSIAEEILYYLNHENETPSISKKPLITMFGRPNLFRSIETLKEINHENEKKFRKRRKKLNQSKKKTNQTNQMKKLAIH